MAKILTTDGGVNISEVHESGALDATGQPPGLVPTTDGAGGFTLTTPAGSGDMTKATYDTNNDGTVDSADNASSVPWGGITGAPSTFPPSAHSHTASEITDAGALATLDKVTAGEVDTTGAGAGDVLTADGVGGASFATPGAGAITYAENILGAPVALSSGAWATGCSLVLGAGTWLITGTATIRTTSNTANEHSARLHDGSTDLASAQNGHARQTGVCSALTVQAVLVVALSATVTLQARDSASASNLEATAPNTGAGNATRLVAIKLA